MNEEKKPNCKVYIVYFNADSSKEEKEFEKELNNKKHLVYWTKNLQLNSKN
jgi:hypothetical protein